MRSWPRAGTSPANYSRPAVLANPTPLDGDLTELASTLRETYGSRHVWSISRLEHYQTCSHFFFVSHLLKLEARPEPALGLDARQIGSLYHALFERVYADPPSSLSERHLNPVRNGPGRTHFAAAPRRYGFRAAAWWSHTQKEIVENVVVSLRALAATGSDFVPVDQEKRFGLPDNPLVIADPAGSDDQLLVRGVVDRVYRNGAGQIRVIDYKLGGPASFTARELVRGRKLQLPLYAQAMQEALSWVRPSMASTGISARANPAH
ncbi:MAG: PD-(D/E)XK nuclease family protein [Chloroflexi bacterium]|nr:PD-(D/E)XK nuclease family protein [Chloroflexota bacterium]